jgi:hypothetical protein
MYDWFLAHFPLLVSVPEGGVVSTLRVMEICFLISVILLGMAVAGTRGGHYCEVEHYLFIIGFTLLGIGIVAALVGAPIILYIGATIGKWSLLIGGACLSIYIIVKAVNVFYSVQSARRKVRADSSSTNSPT